MWEMECICVRKAVIGKKSIGFLFDMVLILKYTPPRTLFS